MYQCDTWSNVCIRTNTALLYVFILVLTENKNRRTHGPSSRPSSSSKHLFSTRCSTFHGSQSERSAISMKPRASSCFPCASPSVRFYSNPGWGPNSRQALWRALHTHQMKDFHQATAASRLHTNVIFPLKGGHASIERGTVRPYQDDAVLLEEPRTRLHHVRHVCWRGRLVFLWFFHDFFFSVCRKNI